MDSFPAQSAPTHGRNTAAGEFASAVAILALAGLCVVLLAFSSLPRKGEAGDPRAAMPRTISSSLLAPQIDIRMYLVVVGDGDVAAIQSLLRAEAQLRTRLGEKQRNAEIIVVASDYEAEAIAGAINDEQSIPGISPEQAIVVRAR